MSKALAKPWQPPSTKPCTPSHAIMPIMDNYPQDKLAKISTMPWLGKHLSIAKFATAKTKPLTIRGFG